MQIDKQVIDAVNVTVKIELTKSDYQEKVENSLREYRKKANIPGFRPGKVPMGMVKKMYGKNVLVEEVQKKVSEELYNYIKENKLNVLGEPLPSKDQKTIDFDKDEVLEFLFDLALAPELDVAINKRINIPYYNIEVSDKMAETQKTQLIGRYGEYVAVEKSEEKDVVKGVMTELNAEGDALVVEDAIVLPSYFKNDDEKAKMVGVAVGDKITFNPAVAYDNTESEMASLLHVAKEVAKDIKSDFTFEVKEITRFKNPEVNQELFDKIFTKGEVNSEEEFNAKVKESVSEQLAPESDYRFMVDAKAAFLKKVEDVKFPEEALKRWLSATSKEGKKPEDFENELPAMLEDLKWQLIKEKMVKDNDLKVEEKDLLDTAKAVTKAQMAQYGMSEIPEEMLENYAKQLLNNEDQKRNIVDQAMSSVIAKYLKEAVKVNEKDISLDDFQKLYTQADKK